MSFPPPTTKQARFIWMALTGLAIAAIVGLVVTLIWGLGQVINLLSPVLWPLAVAAVIACLLSPVVDWLERRKVARTHAIVLVFILAASLLAGILSSIVPQVVVETQQLVSNVPKYITSLQKQAEQLLAHPPEFLRNLLPAQTNVTEVSTNGVTTTTTPAQLDNKTFTAASDWLAKVLPKINSWLLDQVGKAASWIGVLVGLALIPVYAFYFLLEKRSIKSHWKEYLPIRDSSLKDELVFVLDSINQYLVAFFRGQVLVAICDGILYTISFLVIGLNYAFLLGFVAFLLTMIPFVGPVILCLVSLTLTLAQYGDWQHPLAVLGVVVVIQILESAVISPKIMGDRVGLHALVIIVAVMAGTELLGGLLGGILAIPLAAALRVILFRYVWKQRKA
ncbi:MAG TPA: AI-2E family transporter [Verrucomicrobiae bacterium]|jgi:predicted PurR-regulated permease PerM